MTKYIAAASLLLLLASCKKDEPVYSATPEISVVSVTPSTAKEYHDDIVFTVSYKDGDGDLGENNPDISNLFVTDNRINITYPFRIPQLSPGGTSIIIQGKLNVVLKSTGITNGGSSQTVTYTIYAKDRAGNESNRVTTPAVTVVK